MVWSRKRILSLVSCLLLVAPTALATAENDFSLYPGGAQGCLKEASVTSKCDGDTVPEMNKCLCSNGGSFVTNAARCIGREAPLTLRTVWTTMYTSCSDSNTPLAVNEDDFLSIGQSESGTPSTSTVTSTSGPSSAATGSSTSTPTSEEVNKDNGDSSSGGLSVTAKAGIGIGSAVGAAIIGGIIAMAWKSRSSRAAHDEARQSMLLDGRNSPDGEARIGGYHAAQSGWRGAEKNQWRPTSDMTGLTSISNSTAEGHASWIAQSPSSQQYRNWGHHPDQAWPASPPPMQPSQPLGIVPEVPTYGQSAGLYELSSAEPGGMPPPAHHAIEMPAPQGPRHSPQYPGSNWAR